jgi:hypothetical protein
VRFKLRYNDPVQGIVESIYNEEDFREWIDNWPHWTGPDSIYVERIL